MKNLINTQLAHLREKYTALTANLPGQQSEDRLANYWCGRQTATILMDILDTAHQSNLITWAEYDDYIERTWELKRLLDTAKPRRAF